MIRVQGGTKEIVLTEDGATPIIHINGPVSILAQIDSGTLTWNWVTNAGDNVAFTDDQMTMSSPGGDALIEHATTRASVMRIRGVLAGATGTTTIQLLGNIIGEG